MSVRNMMEDLVMDCMKEMVGRNAELRELDERKHSDIIALALNHLPPKYVSTHRGELMMKTQLRNSLVPDVYRALSNAAEIVMYGERKSDFTENE